ncbi:MAG: hypothetical protein M1812_005110 [Candelaria pacifica]|nr:MAG: hypothetical protein M1812_005110 [Candelaria pacifica]
MGLFGNSFVPKTDIPDLTGKVILVTGGNTGLGKESILQLIQHNSSQIYLAARTPSKAEAAIADIKAAVPDASITYLPLDLTSLSSVKEAAETFKSKSDKLHILLNNAGIMATPMSETKEGYEIQFGTNHIGHALLTKLLMPTLLKTAEEPNADVRIVNLSSFGHNMAPSGGIIYETAKLGKEGPWARYGQSKLANILFTKELARRYPSITSVAVHPGIIKTDLYVPTNESSMVMRYGMMVFSGLFMKDVAEGAKNQLWAATSKDKGIVSGGYYDPIGKKSGGSNYAKDGELAKKLWEWTEGELVKNGY